MTKNYGICHSCKQSGHWLDDCPKKRRCPNCGQGFVRWLEVEKMSPNRGRLFFSCDNKCGYFKWDEGESSGSDKSSNSSDKSGNKVDTEDLARLLKMCAQISDEDDVEISLNITIRKGNGTVHKKEKEKL